MRNQRPLLESRGFFLCREKVVKVYSINTENSDKNTGFI
jgi:hypothetical protein